MLQERNESVKTMKRLRRKCVGGAIMLLALTGLAFNSGCNEEEALQIFRDTATENLQSGVKTIMDGVIDGLFAIVQANSDSTSDSTTDTTSE